MGSSMSIGVIIQARVGSSRLPGKVLLEVMGKTILEYVIERVRESKKLEQVIVATTNKKKDKPISDLAKKLKVDLYRGSENDVLDRYYQAAKKFQLEHIVRITADCPLIDSKVIDNVVDYYFDSGADYSSNTLEETFPDGQDVEVFSLESLKEAWQNAELLSEREHVTSYIIKNKDSFKLTSFKNSTNLSLKRWTLDEKEDFVLIKSVIENLYPSNPGFRMDDILFFLRNNPQIDQVNRFIMRNQGYQESRQKEKS